MIENRFLSLDHLHWSEIRSKMLHLQSDLRERFITGHDIGPDIGGECLVCPRAPGDALCRPVIWVSWSRPLGPRQGQGHAPGTSSRCSQNSDLLFITSAADPLQYPESLQGKVTAESWTLSRTNFQVSLLDFIYGYLTKMTFENVYNSQLTALAIQVRYWSLQRPIWQLMLT